MNNRPVLLMTACINPNGMPDTVLQDSKIRLDQYVKAVEFYLKNTDFQILFIDNSGYDISSFFSNEVNSGRLEVIAYQGNDFDRSLGKGYGECLVIETALMRSHLLSQASGIVKVSGRHIVKNVITIFRISKALVSTGSFVVCEINKKTRGANSDMFIGTKDFFEHLVANKNLIDESKGAWFEHALYETIDQFVKVGREFQHLPIPLFQFGQSGSMGTQFPRPSIKMYFLNGIKSLLYKLKILKVC